MLCVNYLTKYGQPKAIKGKKPVVRTLIGTRIRERRRAFKLTQVALAKSVGISASYLNLIEHNRRGIAGKTLLAIARELKLQPADLAEGSDAVLINNLTEIARIEQAAKPEVDRIEEFVGRYPGWAKLIGILARTTAEQRESLTAMTDQMAQHPFVSETMHQILSNITAISSTAGILATSDELPRDLEERFLGNLSKDSERLSVTAQKMVAFFDRDQESTVATPSAAQDYWAVRGFVLTEEDKPERPKNDQSSDVLHSSMTRYQRVDRALPAEAFAEAAADLGYDPLALASMFSVPVVMVLFRMAQIPAVVDFPKFGVIEVDVSGAILMRKPTDEFTLPMHSSACPLWPVYRAFAQPGRTLRANLEMPSGDRVLAYALSETVGADSYSLPPVLRSTMIFSSDPRVLPKTPEVPILAGLHCSVCARKNCYARRVDYILA